MSFDYALARTRLYDLRRHTNDSNVMANLYGDHAALAPEWDRRTITSSKNAAVAATDKNRRKVTQEIHVDPYHFHHRPNTLAPSNYKKAGARNSDNISSSSSNSSPSPQRESSSSLHEHPAPQPVYKYTRRVSHPDKPSSSLPVTQAWKSVFAKRMHISHFLDGHTGCVNTVEFNSAGTLLLSGSDDTRVGIFDTADWSNLGFYPTAHTRNIFHAVFIPHSGDRTIVSCGLDGCTVMTQLDEAGSAVASSTIINESSHMTSSVAVSPLDSNLVFVARGAGGIACIDLRLKKQVGGFSVGPGSGKSCNSLAQHPRVPTIFAVGTDSPIVYMCDSRMMLAATSSAAGAANSGTAAAAAISAAAGGAAFLAVTNRAAVGRADGVGGVNWSNSGDRLIVSMKGADVVAYDWTSLLPQSNRKKVFAPSSSLSSSSCSSSLSVDCSLNTTLAKEINEFKYGAALDAPCRVYRGRENTATMFKEALFFGPSDAFVITGGDDGHLFIWDADSTRLLHKYRADADIVNGVLANPKLPVVISCGIDSTIKVSSISNLKKKLVVVISSTSSSAGARASPAAGSASRRKRSDDQQEGENAGDEDEEDDDDDQSSSDEEPDPFSGQSEFSQRQQLMRQLFGRAGIFLGARFGIEGDNHDDDDNNKNKNDVDDDEVDGQIFEADGWENEADIDDDDENGSRRPRRREDSNSTSRIGAAEERELAEERQIELRSILEASCVILRQEAKSEGSLAELLNFYEARASGLRRLREVRTIISTRNHDDDDDEDDDDGDDDSETEFLRSVIREQQQQQQQPQRQPSSSSSSGKDEDENEEEDADADDAPGATTTTTTAPKITVEGPFDAEEKKSQRIADAAADEGSRHKSRGRNKSKSTGRKGNDDEDSDEVIGDDGGNPASSSSSSSSAASDDDGGEGDEEEDDDENDDEDSDDMILLNLLDAVSGTMEVAETLARRLTRGGLLSGDPITPAVGRARQLLLTGAGSSATTTTTNDSRHPLLRLLSAVITVPVAAFEGAESLSGASDRVMQQCLAFFYGSVLQLQATVLCALGELDEALMVAMRILEEGDDESLPALGVAVAVLRAKRLSRNTSRHPVPHRSVATAATSVADAAVTQQKKGEDKDDDDDDADNNGDREEKDDAEDETGDDEAPVIEHLEQLLTRASRSRTNTASGRRDAQRLLRSLLQNR